MGKFSEKGKSEKCGIRSWTSEEKTKMVNALNLQRGHSHEFASLQLESVVRREKELVGCDSHKRRYWKL